MASYVTVTELAEATGIPETTVRRHIRQGTLQGEKVGQTWVINPSAADSWVRSYQPWKRAAQ